MALLPWEDGYVESSPPPRSPMEFWSDLLRGSFPELVANPGRNPYLWQASYIQTYIERDIRTLRHVGDLMQFQSFLKALAARSAQLLVVSDLARNLGVAVNTAKAWLSVLEATHQVIILRPYYLNAGKRLVKTPKVYFSDIGVLCFLTGLTDPTHAAAGPMAGPIMETAVITEIWKRYLHRGLDPRLWFWRTSAGSEVDLIVETESGLVPIEVKTSATPHPSFARSIELFRKDFGDRARPGYVVHPGDTRLPLGGGTTAFPFSAV
jgi:hypothetical protein